MQKEICEIIELAVSDLEALRKDLEEVMAQVEFSEFQLAWDVEHLVMQ
jgi:hypothetical protein